MATLDDTDHGSGGFGSTGLKQFIQSPPQKDKKGKKKKSSPSQTPGSRLWQATNSVNMVVGVDPGPSSTSWMARESTYVGIVAFPDYVPGGTTVEAGESTAGVDSSSKTQRWRTIELVARIGRRPLRVLWIQGRLVTTLMLKNAQQEE